MNISAWAIRSRVPVILLFIVLTLWGLTSYFRMGINENPDVDFPVITVGVAQAGASPEELETEVTRKVEDALVGVANLDTISSTVTDGMSTTVLEFEVGSDTQRALNDVRDAVTRIRMDLPADITEPAISQIDFSGEPFITYTIGSKTRSVDELSRLVDEDITRALLTVPGVSQIRRSGGLDREIRVELDPARLRGLGLTVDQVNAQIRGLNINLPGGRADIGAQEQGIRTLGSARTVEDLRALPIPLPNGGYARLDALGKVEDTHAEVRQIAKLDDDPVVAFSAVRSKGAALVQTEQGVVKAVAELEQQLPPDIEIRLIRTMATYTRESFQASLDALVIGALLAVAVIYLFLRNWQATIISALAIPLSVIATFGVMKALGYTLNGITMLALTLVVGVLVDDAIVDLENIYRHITMGKDPMRAALEATEEIGLAVVATTMTIVAVFVPVAFMGGIPGQFFRSFGITVAVAVLFSLLVARTLTPMMAAYMLPRVVEHEERPPFYLRFYQPVLRWALAHRVWTGVAAIAIFVGSLMLVPMIPKGLFGSGDIGESSIAVTLPAGSTLADTERVADAVRRLVADHSAVARVFTTVGSAGGGTGIIDGSAAVTNASVAVILKPKHERHMGLKQFEDEIRPLLSSVPGARVNINAIGVGGGGKPVNLVLRGTNAEELNRVADTVLTQMRGLGELRDVTSTAAEQRPEIHIRPDMARAAEQGVSVTTISRLARLATQGDVSQNLAKFNAETKQLNIRVQLPRTARDDVAAIGDMLVPGKAGLVPLRSVADIEVSSGPVEIRRRDRARQVTLQANLTAGNLGTAMEKIQALPAMRNLPATVTQDTQGESKIMMDVFMGFAFALGTAVLLIYVVLVLLFGGFLQPVTIMMALPLSIGGALLGLLVAQKEMGMMALIGIVMLMGLVTKNSILLVEYAQKARGEGLDRHEALMRAGRDRLRPILMTTVAMIAGMMPIALAIGEGTEPLSPMAVAVIGGLVTSMLLTLVVVPAGYTFVDDFQNGLRRLWRRFRRADGAALEAKAEAPVRVVR